MTWAAVWRFLKSWPGGVVVGALGALVAVAILSARSSAAPGPTPYTAEPTKRAEAADKVTEQLPIQVLKPAEKVRAKIARDYREPGIMAPAQSQQASGAIDGQLISGSGFAKEILSELKFAPAPDGGTALTTIDRSTGLPETTILQKQGISWRNRWLIGGLYGESETHDPAKPRDKYWRVRGVWTPACRRMACTSIEGGAFGGWMPTTAYAGVEISIGSR